MKIVIVSNRGDLVTGGIEQWLLRLAASRERRGTEISVALPEHGPVEEALMSLGIPVMVFDAAWQPRTHAGRNRYLAGLDARVAHLADWVDEQGADLVHSNACYLLEGALAAMRAGRPHVWHIHSVFGTDADPYVFGGLGLSPVRQASLLAMLSDGVGTVSAAAAKVFADAGIPVTLIRNRIDLDAFDHRRIALSNVDLRGELGLARQTPLVAVVARISPEKDLPTFVECCAQIRNSLPTAHYLIIGNTTANPRALQAVRDRINACGLHDRVHLLGERTDLPGLYPQFDLFMLTSTNEGLSSVLQEAMAAALPVISTRSAGSDELIEDGVSGFLTPIGDAAALADAALRCLNDRTLAASLGARGRQKLERESSWSDSLSALANFYHKVIERFSPSEQAIRRAFVDAAIGALTDHAHLASDSARVTATDEAKPARPSRGPALLRWLTRPGG